MASQLRPFGDLVKRIDIPAGNNPSPGLLQALTVDPWAQSGKYGLAWTYFALAMTGAVIVVRIWHWWQDKIRQAMYKQEVEEHYRNLYRLDPTSAVPATLATEQNQGRSQHFFPEVGGKEEMAFRPTSNLVSIGFINATLALFRYIFYRPIPDVVWGKRRFTFSSLAVLAIGFVALGFATILCFLPQPLYWTSIRFGSPPLAVRSGMMAIALTPWIFATSAKANLLTLMTGIGPERLNVLHRWLGYLCLFLSLVHTIPFYIQPVWEDGGMAVFATLFPPGIVIYGSGIACIVPLFWLCVASLPLIRRKAYELFVIVHIPAGWVYVGLLFWHTKNFLLSWSYLYTTIAIYVVCNLLRLAKLNWAKPWRMAFLVGDEAAINIMAESCIKITIPTQIRWKAGQYVYLRMPGISVLDNHPFTVSSLCSEDFPSEYGEQHRDCVLVFRPYNGFTRKVLETAVEKGPYHTYRAFVDGPYGGMRRELAAFDTVILIAGGSGITSLMSQLLNLIKRMRDGKAITKRVVVVWALKRLEAMDWFREELRICRESAPPESVTCKFFVTAAVRHQPAGDAAASTGHRTTRPLSNLFHDKLDGFVAGVASKRNSAMMAAEAAGKPDQELEQRAEPEDGLTKQKQLQPHQSLLPLPSNMRASRNAEEALKHLEGRDEHGKSSEAGQEKAGRGEFHFPPLIRHDKAAPHFNLAPPEGRKRYSQFLATQDPASTRPSHSGTGSVGEGPSSDANKPDAPDWQDISGQSRAAHLRTDVGPGLLPQGPAGRPNSTFGPPSGFEFGFASTPTEFQKSLTRFAFPVPHQIDGGWSIEYGRPDLAFMLRDWATGGADGRGILGRRTAVFVCGPPAMRVGVAATVARLQAEIWGDEKLEEIFLHTENYTL